MLDELIDTLWNVNNWMMQEFLFLPHELIDTLWNVNPKPNVCGIPATTGINRYIMECKFRFFTCIICTNRELIDTLWNVNVLVPQNIRKLRMN